MDTEVFLNRRCFNGFEYFLGIETRYLMGLA